jgi:hypothetical protein
MSRPNPRRRAAQRRRWEAIVGPIARTCAAQEAAAAVLLRDIPADLAEQGALRTDLALQWKAALGMASPMTPERSPSFSLVPAQLARAARAMRYVGGPLKLPHLDALFVCSDKPLPGSPTAWRSAWHGMNRRDAVGKPSAQWGYDGKHNRSRTATRGA